MGKNNQQKSKGKGTAGEKKAPPAQPVNLVTSSGITQPHNAKKEALGPNTNR